MFFITKLLRKYIYNVLRNLMAVIVTSSAMDATERNCTNCYVIIFSNITCNTIKTALSALFHFPVLLQNTVFCQS